MLGYDYDTGTDGFPRSAARAIKFYTEACSLGVAWGCSNAGLLYRTNEGLRNETQALQILEKGCEMGDSAGSGKSCFRLGRMHANGEADLQLSIPAATELYLKACDLGNANGCGAAGHQLRTDPTVRDYEKAAVFLEKGCEMDAGKASGSACNNLGIMNRRGEGPFEASLATANDLYIRACELGEPWGAQMLQVT